MPVVPLLKFRNIFISSAGYVFKISNGKEEIIKPFKTKKSKEVFIPIENKSYNLLHLMTQHFIGDLKITDRVKHTITPDLRIQLSSIIVKPAIGKNGLSKEDEVLMYKYKCDFKASSANSRSEQKITPVDVFSSLKIHGFKCIYCGIHFHYNNWHLDHFSSLSKGGKNIIQNIVPSCDVCNIMKGAMDGNQFYAMCRKIFNNYMFKDSLGEIHTKK